MLWVVGVDGVYPLPEIFCMQGRSHQYGCSSFNQTSFRGNNHISANILEFGSTS